MYIYINIDCIECILYIDIYLRLYYFYIPHFIISRLDHQFEISRFGWFIKKLDMFVRSLSLSLLLPLYLSLSLLLPLYLSLSLLLSLYLSLSSSSFYIYAYTYYGYLFYFNIYFYMYDIYISIYINKLIPIYPFFYFFPGPTQWRKNSKHDPELGTFGIFEFFHW